MPQVAGEGTRPSLPLVPNPEAAITVRGVSKRYGGVLALDNTDLVVGRGTVHAIVGENGAGKSTLMKILAGAQRPDAGTIAIAGEVATLNSPQDARQRGIGIVYQELSLFPSRSVLANLFINAEPTVGGLVSVSRMRERAGPVLRRVGLDVDPSVPVGQLTVGQRQLVEISRVLLASPQVLILDEPNSALSARETGRLFTVLHELRQTAITIIYVSHRLEEVFEIAEMITVLRNGRDVFTRDRNALTVKAVAEAMIGAREVEVYPASAPASAKTAKLVVRALSAGSQLRDVSFEARAGEVVGLAGLEGAGVAPLFEALFGLRKTDGGEATFPDGGGLPSSATSAARRGICFVPADRRRDGLMLDRSISFNIAHVAVGSLAHSPWLSLHELSRRAQQQVKGLQIRARSVQAPVNELSGGNQQKIVLGKWLEVAPSVLLLDDPTRGVDVGAKSEIYALIRTLASHGRVIVFSSTELPELIGLCDRILILYRGRLAGEFRRGAVDTARLLHAVNTGSLN